MISSLFSLSAVVYVAEYACAFNMMLFAKSNKVSHGKSNALSRSDAPQAITILASATLVAQVSISACE